jgi:hypothetical protein
LNAYAPVLPEIEDPAAAEDSSDLENESLENTADPDMVVMSMLEAYQDTQSDNGHSK